MKRETATKLKKAAIAAGLAVAAATGAFAPSTAAFADVLILAPTAPPAPREEIAPPAREDAVWVKGHWRWTGHDYAWEEGHWRPIEAAHRHRQFVDGGWVQTPRGWEWREESWH